MSFTRTLGGLALVTVLIAGCDTTPTTGPLSTMPTGTSESLLRQQQLQNAQQNPGMQNPVATGASPGVGGIERAATGGTGSAGGQVGGMRSDGSIVRPGGAPSTQSTVPSNPRRPQPTTN